ncbi:hypothetical protein CK203_059283 [Vitis vinifera]|uniref:Uncharacterized protein n=1 Tax=Vitis vinifera TaxID=29760 RepID=A0A438FST4_VITVI|nr:hypothetical protein CK203_059283 [Vitis vinifera]
MADLRTFKSGIEALADVGHHHIVKLCGSCSWASTNWTSFAGTFGYTAPGILVVLSITIGICVVIILITINPHQLLSSAVEQVAEEVVLGMKLASACLHVNPQYWPTMQQASGTLNTMATIVKTIFDDYTGRTAWSLR